MKAFTYSDYIRCIHTVRIHTTNYVSENSETYEIQMKKKTKIHDKLIKDILKDKNEMMNFINNFLYPKEEVNIQNLQMCTNSFINRRYEVKEADVIYKMKNKNIYFLVEHQSSVDYNMPYRILNYCIDIIQEWSRAKTLKKANKYPIIVPIVIYTGEHKWTTPVNYADRQLRATTYEKYKICLSYNLIDISKIDERFLLKQNSMFGYTMLIEKSKNKKELIKNIYKIINQIQDEQKLYKLSKIIIYLLSEILEIQEEQRLLNEIEKKAGVNKMSTLAERIKEENKREIKIAERNIKIQIARKMLFLGHQDKSILEVTEIDDKDLQKLKYKMKKQI